MTARLKNHRQTEGEDKQDANKKDTLERNEGR